MKLKVGSKVIVKSNLEEYNNWIKNEDYLHCCPPMFTYSDKVLTIADVIEMKDGKTRYKVKENPFIWNDDMFEKSVDFTLDDLEPGMVVELANGSRRMFVNEKFLGTEHYSELNDYNMDLTCGFDSLQINKVFKCNSTSLWECFRDYNLKLIWQRNQKKKMSLKEIENELGYEIELVNEEESK